jgi:hypothetical protein
MSAPTTTTATPEENAPVERTPQEVMAFDPFMDSTEDEAPDPEPVVEPEAVAPASASASAPAPAVPVAPDTSVPPADLVGMNRHLMETNAALVRQLAAPAGPTPAAPAAPGPVEDPIPQYLFDLPKDVVEAVLSDDPALRVRGLQAMFSGALQTAHKRIREEYRGHVSVRERELSTRIQAEMKQTGEGQRIFSDFYTKFPTLNEPALRSIVQHATQNVSAETGARSWTPELRDKIGERVFSILGKAVPAASAESPRLSNVVAHPRMRGASTRPEGVTRAASEDEDPQQGYLSDVLAVSGIGPRTRS